MRLLVDTHILLWLLNATLAQSAANQIEAAERVFISHASLWELAVKQSSGRLSLPDDLLEQIGSRGIDLLPIRVAHIQEIAKLPRLHGDPFDRMLIAQARCDGLVLMTHDRAVLRYEVKTMAV